MRFAIIENGVVANIAEAEEPLEENWVPAGDAAIGDLFDGDGFTTPPPPPGTVAGVLAERARRLAAGFDYDFDDVRGIHRIGTAADDLIGWDEVTKGSQAAIALGMGAAPIAIVTDTGPATITAIEWQMILLAATAFRQPIWQASFALQAMDPIPADLADDAWWQAA